MRRRLAEDELTEAREALDLAQNALQTYVKRVALAATEPDLFSTEERLAAEHGIDSYFDSQREGRRINEGLAPAEEEPTSPPEGWHRGACGVGEFAGVCKYGDPECPVLNDPEAEIEEPKAEPGAVEFVQESNGTVTIRIGERSVARGGGLKPITLPAGEVTGLLAHPRFWVWWDIAASAWKASSYESQASGSARINVGAFSPAWVTEPGAAAGFAGNSPEAHRDDGAGE